MEMIQVINGKIAQYSLSKTGTLKNGSRHNNPHTLRTAPACYLADNTEVLIEVV